MRVKKSIYNIIAGLGYEVARVISSLILPRLILTRFGSDYNGLVSAITQFLLMATVLQAGLGGVVKAALYKPLAENDLYLISVITKTATAFLRKIALVYAGIVLVIAVVYPFFVIEDFGFLFSSCLVLIMSLSTFANFFVAGGYTHVVLADQKHSVWYGFFIIAITVSTGVSALLIYLGFGIHAVKLAGTLGLCLQPVLIWIYVKKKYKPKTNVKKDNNLLKQRWDNFAQELALFICSSADLVILSVFTNVYEVSVYTVHMLVINGVYGIIHPFIAGVEAAFGNMFAKKEEENIKKSLRVFEMMAYALATLFFGVTLVMITPFVMLYTNGVTDVNYYRPLISALIVTGGFFRVFRMPYMIVVTAAGHFKQTKNGAIVEMTLNIIISLSLVFKFGMLGVVAATLFSMVFRTVQYAFYVSGHIVKRSVFIFIKRVLLSAAGVVCIAGAGYYYNLGFGAVPAGFIGWAANAAQTTLIAAAVVMFIEVAFYRKDLVFLYSLWKKR